MFSLSQIDKIGYKDFFNQISNTAGTLLQTSWSDNVGLSFSPDFAIVRQVTYATLSTGDAQIYEVLSSLTNNESIATFPGSNSTVGATINPIISNPQQLIKLTGNPLDSVSFSVVTRKTDGTIDRSGPSAMATGESSSLSIKVQFIKLK
tara:strand:- start:80 stop:526 length:447 start_codon:yes stop_codon:yes gene_type:complete